ncbi:MAG: bifunctional 4-hydroxy-2-oxoglutarate aldolase/2-dehydro-3-deoxy-phosphogluconate aldolase [Verrucomicrobiales bacterium]|jgi:2-dehydro-3-deoxyphosphogluconate aldolase/(4S)-4-hydroxy-2-oxoglutarate aldolase|nr:bifunctional 4-hydroxy-2-oxoglutarate aldolase/2-dehydro-3-deoxy-phosphogluconate aldolase [Verrucomicrobiales bacterium]
MNALTPTSSPGSLLLKNRLLAVLVIDSLEAAIPVAESLLAGGVRAMELTLRTPVAFDAVRTICSELPEMTVGVGTVLTTEQVDEVHDTGADFGVSPGTNLRILRRAAEIGLPFGPGVMTPTDIDTAIGEGARLLKYFPAESSGGLAHLNNIAAPFGHLGLKFIPLGGVSLANLEEYLASDWIGAVGGSWLAPRNLIQEGNWKQIEENAREACRRLSA